MQIALRRFPNRSSRLKFQESAGNRSTNSGLVGSARTGARALNPPSLLSPPATYLPTEFRISKSHTRCGGDRHVGIIETAGERGSLFSSVTRGAIASSHLLLLAVRSPFYPLRWKRIVHHGAADKRIKNFGSNWPPIVKETLVRLTAGREIRIRIWYIYVCIYIYTYVCVYIPPWSLSPFPSLASQPVRRGTCLCLPTFPSDFQSLYGPNRRFRILRPLLARRCRVVIGAIIGTNTVTIAGGIFNNKVPVVSRSSLLALSLFVSLSLSNLPSLHEGGEQFAVS